MLGIAIETMSGVSVASETRLFANIDLIIRAILCWLSRVQEGGVPDETGWWQTQEERLLSPLYKFPSSPYETKLKTSFFVVHIINMNCSGSSVVVTNVNFSNFPSSMFCFCLINISRVCLAPPGTICFLSPPTPYYYFFSSNKILQFLEIK